MAVPVLQEYANKMDELPLWYEMKNVTKGPMDSFYLIKPMGDSTLHNIVYNGTDIMCLI